ncbi:MAG TPA: ABC transporter ATP-binding protein [Chloroflexota bacterium]|nr:ABC transporter ATP-binding protein [Chloroflexota bacterium]
MNEPALRSEPSALTASPVLEARGLTKHFHVGGIFSGKTLHAVDDFDLSIYPGEIVALVGESGSGKSTVARLLAQVYKPTSGEILYRGTPIESLHAREYRRHVQMVFQDPFSSLNPVYRASHGVLRSLKLYSKKPRSQLRQEAARILDLVGLTPSDQFLDKYPYELSGGQRQRYGFAQALACGPDLILADEPVSMLDVSIRLGILNLMADLCRDEGLAFLYITHDIASARYVADRMLVMYAGEVVEDGPTEDVLQHPKHPYTQLLLSAVPDPNAPAEAAFPMEMGEPPRVIDPKPGSRFCPRCPYAIPICSQETPRLRLVRPNHRVACHVAQAEEAIAEAVAQSRE